ncbi:MAG: metal-dependent hydrolase [Candidatus Methylomirabilales bacterium]
MVLGLAALAPDIDVISYLWGAEVYSRFHHTFTHTIWGVMILAVALAGIERSWVRQIPFPRLVALNLAGCSIHMLGDMIALWPLQLLWPLSDQDFALRWTGDFDLVVLIVVGLATGLAATDGLQGRTRWILGGGVLILAAYFWWFPGAAGLR